MRKAYKAYIEALSESEKKTFSDNAVKQALKEFENIKTGIFKWEFEDLVSHLLDNGKSLKMQKVEVIRDEFEDEIELEAQIIKMFDEVGAKPSSFIAYRELAKTFEPIMEGEIEDWIGEIEHVIVSFKLEGSGEIGKKMFPNLYGRINTIEGDGTLVVIMKRIRGKWYWNPFGW